MELIDYEGFGSFGICSLYFLWVRWFMDCSLFVGTAITAILRKLLSINRFAGIAVSHCSFEDIDNQRKSGETAITAICAYIIN